MSIVELEVDGHKLVGEINDLKGTVSPTADFSAFNKVEARCGEDYAKERIRPLLPPKITMEKFETWKEVTQELHNAPSGARHILKAEKMLDEYVLNLSDSTTVFDDTNDY